MGLIPANWTFRRATPALKLDMDVQTMIFQDVRGSAQGSPMPATAVGKHPQWRKVRKPPRQRYRSARILMLVQCRHTSEHVPFEATFLLRFSGTPCLSSQDVLDQDHDKLKST